MAIVTLDDDDLFGEDGDVPVISNTGSPIVKEIVPSKSAYESVEIVNSDKQLEKIIQYIDGEEWTVDYYLQAITKDNEIGLFDPDAPTASIQYVFIRDLILFVDTPLSQDVAQNITGTAYINANVTPNQGDAFTAELLGKRRALFTVTSVEKRNYNLNNVFLIEYRVNVFYDGNDTVLDSLREKIVKRYFYDKNFLSKNSSPLLLEDKYRQTRKIEAHIPDLTNNYFRFMLDTERNVLSVPGQEFVIVDIMLQEFLFKVVNIRDIVGANKIQRHSTIDEYMRQETIWDALAKRELDIIFRCSRKVTVVSTATFNQDIRLRDICYLGVQYVIYPSEPDVTIATLERLPTPPTIRIKSVENPYRDNKGTIENLIPVFDEESDFYVFTEAFYLYDTENMSILETLVYRYLNNEILDTTWIEYLLEDYKFWNRVQQYYYMPILMLLLRDHLDSTFSLS